MQTITAIIPARNEEKNIERCIRNLQWCDRIVVMWMGSDRTGEIARKLGAEVVVKNKSDKDDFVLVQKNINWAIEHCTTDWTLRIDADEVVTEELRNEILSVIGKLLTVDNTERKPQTTNHRPPTNFVAYGIPRSQYFNGGFLKGGDWSYDRLVRLFRPLFCKYDPLVAVHEQFKVNGKTGYLKNKLLHYSHPTFKDAVCKFQKYTDVEINDLHLSKQRAFWNMIIQPPYVFLRWMIWHYGYRDGYRGVAAAAMRGWYEYLLYSKYLRKK